MGGRDINASAACANIRGVRRGSFHPSEIGLLCFALAVVCTDNLIRVDDVMESPKLAE